jgi:hypothetical protein
VKSIEPYFSNSNMDVRVLNEVDEGDNSKDNDLNFTEESCQVVSEDDRCKISTILLS